MKKIRPSLAGSFYPSTKQDCLDEIEEMNKRVKIIDDKNLKYIAGIVPHAGWFYSGSIANSVFQNLKNKNAAVELIVLYGGHFPANYKTRIVNADICETPLGEIKINNEVVKILKNQIKELSEEESFGSDNTIEVQLPFIKYYFPDVELVIIRVAANQIAYSIGKIASSLTQKYKTIFIGSTDLTHYGMRFGFTPAGIGEKAVRWVKEQNDKRIVDLAVNVEYEKIIEEAEKNYNACCPGSLAALVATAHFFNIKKGALVEYKTSYDVLPEGAASDFVGYMGVIF